MTSGVYKICKDIDKMNKILGVKDKDIYNPGIDLSRNTGISFIR